MSSAPNERLLRNENTPASASLEAQTPCIQGGTSHKVSLQKETRNGKNEQNTTATAPSQESQQKPVSQKKLEDEKRNALERTGLTQR